MEILQPDASHLLTVIVTLAQAAGARILECRSETCDIRYKSDASPVTSADLASHRCILAGLKKIQPDWPIISEENVSQNLQGFNASSYWLVDPLDGTKEFIAGRDSFTVNIALIRNQQPLLGVVHAPALAETYFALAGHGVWKQTGSTAAIAIRARRTTDPPKVLLSLSHAVAEEQEFLRRLGKYALQRMGSSLKFCLLAEGAADVYLRHAPTALWDTAAAQVILETAGGEIVDLQGHALRYQPTQTLINPAFIAFGDRDHNWLGFTKKNFP